MAKTDLFYENDSVKSIESKALQSKIDEFEHLVEQPVIGTSDNKKTAELWDRLEQITTAAGRADYAQQIYDMCSTLDNAMEPEISVNQLFSKLAKFGDVAVRVLAWKSVANHLLQTLRREFRQWEASVSAECHQNALEVALGASVTTVDAKGGQKENRFTPSSVQSSNSRLEEALIRLYPEQYEEYKTLIEYVEHLTNTAHDLYYIVQAAHKANAIALEGLSRNGA